MSELRNKLASLTTVASVKDTYPEGSTAWNKKIKKVTPLNIVYTELAGSLESMPLPQAVETVVNRIKELNTQYGDDPDFNTVSDEYLYRFTQIGNGQKNTKSFMKYFTNAVLNGEGLGVVASVKIAGTTEINNLMLEFQDIQNKVGPLVANIKAQRPAFEELLGTLYADHIVDLANKIDAAVSALASAVEGV